MNEENAEGGPDFSDVSHDELLEIVNSSPGRYRPEVVEGAKNELGRREGDAVRAEAHPQFMTDGAQPPVLPEFVPAGKLYSTGQIAMATALGAPISGCLLLAQNYRVLGKVGSAWRALIVGVVSTILLFTLALFLPEKFPNIALPAGSCIGMYYHAKQQQGGAIDNHFKAGGRKGSTGAMLLVSFGCAVISLVLFVAVAMAFDVEPPGGETGGPRGPIAKVRVSQAGQIELDGTNVTLGQLRYAVTKLKEADGGVWYYRERPTEPPPAAAEKAIRIIVDAGVPVRMSSKPDFSDYLDADGNSIPSP